MESGSSARVHSSLKMLIVSLRSNLSLYSSSCYPGAGAGPEGPVFQGGGGCRESQALSSLPHPRKSCLRHVMVHPETVCCTKRSLPTQTGVGRSLSPGCIPAPCLRTLRHFSFFNISDRRIKKEILSVEREEKRATLDDH